MRTLIEASAQTGLARPLRSPQAAHLDAPPVIIADVHGLMRQGLRQLLEGEGYAVAAEAASGGEALAAVAEHQGCILLLAVSLPGMSGLEVARRLASRGDEVLVVMVTDRDDQEVIFEAFAAGARGFVTKGAEPEQLFTAIEVVARGGTALSAAAAENLGEGIRRLRPAPRAFEQRRSRITDRELEILRLLATPRSTAQIAAELRVSRKTVQNHLAAVYRKLHVHSRPEAIVRGMEAHLIRARAE